MDIQIKELGIPKMVRVHTVGNGDIDEELILDRQFECTHENVHSELVENDQLPGESGLTYGMIYVCADCNAEVEF